METQPCAPGCPGCHTWDQLPPTHLACAQGLESHSHQSSPCRRLISFSDHLRIHSSLLPPTPTHPKGSTPSGTVGAPSHGEGTDPNAGTAQAGEKPLALGNWGSWICRDTNQIGLSSTFPLQLGSTGWELEAQTPKPLPHDPGAHPSPSPTHTSGMG